MVVAGALPVRLRVAAAFAFTTFLVISFSSSIRFLAAGGKLE